VRSSRRPRGGLILRAAELSRRSGLFTVPCTQLRTFTTSSVIVVGAANAGSVIAARLSEGNAARVLAREAGGSTPLPEIAVPPAPHRSCDQVVMRYTKTSLIFLSGPITNRLRRAALSAWLRVIDSLQLTAAHRLATRHNGTKATT
jgi:choline dehydrogenase-like flavoprotein